MTSLRTIVAAVIATALVCPQLLRAQSPEEIFASDVRHLRNRFIELAELIPTEHYGWRPNPGARSVSEVLMHVASSTYFHMQHLGVPIPKGGFHRHRNLEVVVDKESVTKILREAFDHAIANLGGAEASFGGRHSMATHLHEHLGQAIAYTRALELVPPWVESR